MGVVPLAIVIQVTVINERKKNCLPKIDRSIPAIVSEPEQNNEHENRLVGAVLGPRGLNTLPSVVSAQQSCDLH